MTNISSKLFLLFASPRLILDRDGITLGLNEDVESPLPRGDPMGRNLQPRARGASKHLWGPVLEIQQLGEGAEERFALAVSGLFGRIKKPRE